MLCALTTSCDTGIYSSFQERERDHFSQFVTEGFTSYCKRKRRDKVNVFPFLYFSHNNGWTDCVIDYHPLILVNGAIFPRFHFSFWLI